MYELHLSVAGAASLWHHLLRPGNTRSPKGRSQQLYISHEPSLLPEADQSVEKAQLYLCISLLTFSDPVCLNLPALCFLNLKICLSIILCDIFFMCVWIYVCVCSYRVREMGLVKWKQFLGHFMKPVKGDEDAKDQTDRSVWKYHQPKTRNVRTDDLLEENDKKDIFSTIFIG